MKNKIVISVFVCFLITYVGCKKADDMASTAPPIIQSDEADYYKFTHYNQQDLDDFFNAVDDKKKCNNCHASK